MSPKVTVLIPVFNREQFVDAAIRSVLEQDFVDFELVVVDDGSTDGTVQVLEAWRQRDPRIVVVTAPKNLGIPGALNLGLANAHGEYIARLDSDDLMLPRRLAAQVALLDTHPGVSLVSCAYDIVDMAGTHLGTWKRNDPPEVTAFLLNFFNIVGGGGQVMFRLADVREEGGYSVAFPSSEDFDLWCRLRRRGRIETLPLAGMTKRTHGDQSLVRWGSTKRASWTAIMRASLEPYLGRPVTDDEIAALITLWRHDGRFGMARKASAIMGEAFTRFRKEAPRHALRARRVIARQWYIAARIFAANRHPLEAMKYLIRAFRWLIGPPSLDEDPPLFD